MIKKKVITAEEAALLVKSGDTVSTSGFVGSGFPEALAKALEQRFLGTGQPENLTYLYVTAQGNRDGRGAEHFAHRGMLKRVIAGHYNLAPSLGKMILDRDIEGYNLPQGTLSQMMRDAAARKPVLVTHVGLKTFVDPRLQGGKLNDITTEDLVKVINVGGDERLAYKTLIPDIVFLRGTYADESGNVTLEHEVCTSEVTALAQAARNNGGTVICQVKRIVKNGSLDPRLVEIPRIYVDALVVTEDPADHQQSFDVPYDPAMCGEMIMTSESCKPVPLSAKKIIARRAAMELKENTVVNLGIGIPEYISAVAAEEGISDWMTLTVESGVIGGIPAGGSQFGAAANPECILTQPEQFDFYDGGGIDLAFLGLAQADSRGNINVSKFGPRLAGCGGFINITQNAKKVFFCGTFTAGGLKIELAEDDSSSGIRIVQEGSSRKFIKDVEQITFSGEYAVLSSHPVMYITERCVFELHHDGMHLTEIAPGIDLQKDILDQMDFKPVIDKNLKLMDEKLFRREKMGL